MQQVASPPSIVPMPRVSPRVSIKACRPSLVDLRFKGDTWVVENDGDVAVCLGDFQMARVEALALDLPSLNRTLMQLRLGQARRNLTRKANKA